MNAEFIVHHPDPRTWPVDRQRRSVGERTNAPLSSATTSYAGSLCCFVLWALRRKGAVVRWSDAEAGCRSDLHVMRAGSVFGWRCECGFSYGRKKEWMRGGGAGGWAGGEGMLQSGADEDQDEGGQPFEHGRCTVSRHLHDLTKSHRLRLDSAVKCRKNRRDSLYTCMCLLNRLREYKETRPNPLRAHSGATSTKGLENASG